MRAKGLNLTRPAYYRKPRKLDARAGYGQLEPILHPLLGFAINFHVVLTDNVCEEDFKT